MRMMMLILSLGLVACGQEGTAEQAGKQIDQAAARAGDKVQQAKDRLAQKAGKAGEYMDDAAITARIKAEILNDALLEASQITVTTSDGMVTLKGRVGSRSAADRTAEIARSIRGVTSVQNELVVQPTP